MPSPAPKPDADRLYPLTSSVIRSVTASRSVWLTNVNRTESAVVPSPVYSVLEPPRRTRFERTSSTMPVSRSATTLSRSAS